MKIEGAHGAAKEVTLTNSSNINRNIDMSALPNAEAYPIGSIVMYAGSLSKIPNTWTLCNGHNHTPDMTNRGVLGCTLYKANISGGTGHRVVISHTHSATAVKAGAHSHSGKPASGKRTSEKGNHHHPIKRTFRWGNAAVAYGYSATGGDVFMNGGTKNLPSESGGKHTHSFSFAAKKSAGYGHHHTITVGSYGKSGSNANYPPYVKLYFIKKIR